MRPLIRQLRFRLTVPRAVFLAAAVFLFSRALVEAHGFWIVDNANKFLQVQALLGSRFTDPAIPWPGRDIDPGFAFNPLPKPFSYIRDGRLFSQYSLPFAVLSAVLYELLGWWGLLLIPLVSGILLLPGLARLASTLGDREESASAAVLITALGTPVWFYVLIYWEHMPAVCLGVWAAALVLQQVRGGGMAPLVGGCLLAAASVWFRDEMYLYAAVLVGAAALCSPGRRVRILAAGILAVAGGLAPLWWLQWRLFGTPLGFHVQTSLPFADGLRAWAASRPQVFYNLFAAAGDSPVVSLILTLPLLALLILRPSFARRPFGPAVPLALLAGTVTTLVVLAGYLRSGSPLLWMHSTNSLLTVSPLLVAAGLRLREPDGRSPGALPRRWLWCLILGYAFLYGLLSPEERTVGIHWGNRLVLILYPLLAAAASPVLLRWWTLARPGPGWRKGVVILAAAVSLTAQVCSLTLLDSRQAFSRRVNLEISRRPERTVVTDTWWVPQELWSAFYSKAFFYAADQESYRRLLGRLAAVGRRDVLLVTGRPRPAPAEPVATVEDSTLGYFSLWFYRLESPNP
jgi:hypothetical protein